MAVHIVLPTIIALDAVFITQLGEGKVQLAHAKQRNDVLLGYHLLHEGKNLDCL